MRWGEGELVSARIGAARRRVEFQGTGRCDRRVRAETSSPTLPPCAARPCETGSMYPGKAREAPEVKKRPLSVTIKSCTWSDVILQIGYNRCEKLLIWKFAPMIKSETLKKTGSADKNPSPSKAKTQKRRKIIFWSSLAVAGLIFISFMVFCDLLIIGWINCCGF